MNEEVELGGFAFRREVDGSVVIRPLAGEGALAATRFPPAEWAAIVAHVSARGNTPGAR